MENVYFIYGYVDYEPGMWDRKVYESREDAEAAVQAFRDEGGFFADDIEIVEMKVIPKGGE